jgi:hypothetical protein
MGIQLTAPTSFQTNFVAPSPKNVVSRSAAASSDAASSAQVSADALAANKLTLTKQTAGVAANAEEAKEQQTGTAEPGENLGTKFSAKA